MKRDSSEHQVNRRDFLSGAGLGAATLLGGLTSGLAQARPPADSLPTVQLGEHRITRLLAGFNPIGGYSHATSNLSQHMRTYFTVERTVEFLEHCEAQGINAFQFDLTEKVEKVLEIVWSRGSKMKFICLHAERAHDAPLEKLMAYRPIAVVHHGGVTDALFRAGKASQVHDFVRKVHDCGVMAGVSSHKPANIKRMADEGWEADLFMTCFHNLTRTKEEMQEELGFLTVGEPFIASDPDKMTAVVRQLDQPCLAFKILAAGRKCSTQKAVSSAFEYAFANIKKTDAVIVGMFPVYQDEVSLNASFTRTHGVV